MTLLAERTPLFVPPIDRFEADGLTWAIDADAPNWIAVDAGGAHLLAAVSAEPGVAFGTLVARHARDRSLEAGRAWLEVHDFLRALDRARFLSDAPFLRPAYPGRSALAPPEGIRELWIQINNACNLSCAHCLVSSGPGESPGIAPEALRGIVDRAAALGLERLYVTGGE
ncbi:MAG TPA: hypothetical protein VG777_01355, partial [Thermoanaerobaculia bacterium]|nr:hypothetical protein [Thermoanaerobaculia bacterium]